MFPDAKDIPATAAEFDKMLGSLPLEKLTPKTWYIAGASHMGYDQKRLQLFCTIFDSFYPLAIILAKGNEEPVVGATQPSGNA